jgi:hydrogenase expression/formation protein HypE
MKRQEKSKESSFPYPTGKLPAEDLADLLKKYTAKDPSVIVMPGVGKDATVIDFAGRYLVAKTDPITFATDRVGWYAVHVNANDVAAMGGIPRWFLATVLLPAGKTGQKEVEEIFHQISAACQELGVILCGGHTEITVGLDRPIVVGQLLGEANEAKVIVPEKICPGDDILLTKGIAIEGTSIIGREFEGLDGLIGKEWTERCKNLLHSPGISIVREAQIANAAANVHALHDPTEGGLATGLHELAQAGKVGMRVEMDRIPILPETALICRELNVDPLGLIASGALLIAAPRPETLKIVGALQAEGIAATIIAKVWEKEKGVKIHREGKEEDLPVFPRDELARLFEGKKYSSAFSSP